MTGSGGVNFGDRIGEGRLLGEDRNTSRSGKVVLPTEGDLLCWGGKILGRRKGVGRAEKYPRQMVENLGRFHASSSKFSQVRDGKYYPICKLGRGSKAASGEANGLGGEWC